MSFASLVSTAVVIASSYVAVDVVVSECTGERSQTGRFIGYAIPKLRDGAMYLRDEATLRTAQIKAKCAR